MNSNFPVAVAVLTCSDRCFAGRTIDSAGPAVAQAIRKIMPGCTILAACVPDDAAAISSQLRQWAAGAHNPRQDLVLTTGGTGLSPRDVTPEATAAVLERMHPGLLELARRRCGEKNPKAYLSRGQAGTLAQTLIINLPGSPAGAVECLEAIADVLPHALAVLRGCDGHTDSRAQPPHSHGAGG